MNNQKGFTLIEILMVIAIIGLISAGAIFALGHVKKRTRDSIRTADVDQLSKALDLYFNDSGAYPVLTTPTCIDGTDIVSTNLRTAGYIGEAIIDPIFRGAPNCYRYVTDSDGSTFNIRYYLETSAIGEPGFHTAPY